jgi:predicted O-methyltransferase YrrM
MSKSRTERLLPRLVYAARVTRAFAAQPYEAVERSLEKGAQWRDQRAASFPYFVTESSDERLHELIGVSWPCSEVDAFNEVWMGALDDLAERDLHVGRGAYGGWDDGDAKLVRLAWCITRHLRPQRILETGVGRGLTTRALLEALERNAVGHLWSIDLPPLLQDRLADQTAAAVPNRLYKRWTLVSGSSRAVLPGLVADLCPIDFFVHDSMHTTRNVRFELESVWPALQGGGAAVIDDVERNTALGQFLETHPETQSLICQSDDGHALIGCLVKSDPDD